MFSSLPLNLIFLEKETKKKKRKTTTSKISSYIDSTGVL
jgi:hypothetical protein